MVQQVKAATEVLFRLVSKILVLRKTDRGETWYHTVNEKGLSVASQRVVPGNFGTG